MVWKSAVCCCLMIFHLCLINVAQVRGDCTKPLFSDNIIVSPESAKDSYADGETAKLECALGYVPVDPTASRLINCSGTQWTKPQLECKKRTCGHPGEITNGQYLTPEGIEFGATITAECNRGYVVIGVNSRHCLATGWSGKPLECDPASKCLKPADIKDGVFEPVEDSYEFGRVVTYSCVNGDFTLIGSEEITCYENGTFYPDPPQCLVVSCPDPDVPHSEKVEGKPSPPYTYRSFIKYKCDDGYRMNGTDTIVCEVSGWNPPPPRCDEVTCAAPEVKNAKQIGNQMNSYPYKNSIRFECNEGYKLTGSDTMTCGNGGWSPATVQCLEVTCAAPEVKNAKQIGNQMNSYSYKSSIRFECNEGYKLTGSDTMTCGYGVWSPSTVQCLEVTCAAPEVKNAKQIGNQMNSYSYKSSINFECNEGYKLTGSDTMTCGNGVWSPATVQCLEVTCAAPEVKNAKQIGNQMNSYSYKSSIRFECNKGYKLSGSDTMTCWNGVWSPATVQCLEVTCGAPEVKNAKLIGNKEESYKYKSTIRFECNEGYSLTSSDTMTCEKEGWSPSTVQCLVDKGVNPGSHGNSQKPSTMMIAAIVVVLLLGHRSH